MHILINFKHPFKICGNGRLLYLLPPCSFDIIYINCCPCEGEPNALPLPSVANSHAGVVAEGSYSLCGLREGGLHQGHSRNFIEKRSMRKIGSGGEK